MAGAKSPGGGMMNPSLVVTSEHQLKLEDAPVLRPGPGEVLLHVRATGICGSDIHFWKHGRIGDLVVQGDCILGHEAAGEVLQLGPGVTGLSVGEHKLNFKISHGSNMTSN